MKKETPLFTIVSIAITAPAFFFLFAITKVDTKPFGKFIKSKVAVVVGRLV